MILLFFEKMIEDTKTNAPTEDLVAFLKKAYKEALEPYHGWMAQQLFDVSPRCNSYRTANRHTRQQASRVLFVWYQQPDVPNIELYPTTLTLAYLIVSRTLTYFSR